MAVDDAPPIEKLMESDTPSSDADEGPTELTRDVAAQGDELESSADHDTGDARSDAADRKRFRMPMSALRQATMVGLVVVVALGGLAGWLGFQAYESKNVQQRHQLLLSVGRQCALNLTTIDWQHADADVQRVLDSATGRFYDDFSNRSQPFVEVVKQAKSKSVGSISEAGLESVSGNEAQVLVAVTVKTTSAAGEQDPHGWRMRLSVQMVGDQAKVSNVVFVP